MKKENTVSTFAEEHNLSISTAVELFLRAGIVKQSPRDVLTDRDIEVFLQFVRNERKPTKRVIEKSRLSQEQMAFLKNHDVPMSKVFDATGLATPKWKAEMKELDLLVAFGVTPCERKKHQLRARSGHCVQCNSKSLASVVSGRYSNKFS